MERQLEAGVSLAAELLVAPWLARRLLRGSRRSQHAEEATEDAEEARPVAAPLLNGCRDTRQPVGEHCAWCRHV